MIIRAPNELSASEAAKQIAAGKLTSTALVTACLDRIEARDDDVRAWETIDAERALATAAKRDSQAPRGVLHGVPVGLKDIIETKDLPTGYGSSIYKAHQPSIDAACVVLMENAGAIILGKTVTTEFAFVNPSRTRNPHNLAHSPGGSSSGSAAAVADQMVPVAFGTQTGGSIIRPSSFNGVVGYKPGFGSFSYSGIKVLAGSLCTLGALARSVQDHALVRSAMLGARPDIVAPGRPPKIGYCQTPWWDHADEDCRKVMASARDSLAAKGADIDSVELPDSFGALPDLNRVIMTYEGLRSLAPEIRDSSDLLSDALKEAMWPAKELAYDDYLQALKTRARLRREFDALMSDYDGLLVPSATGEAPEGFETTGDSIFNAPWTTLGTPCITLPHGVGKHNLPIGVQLTCGRYSDEQLLGVAGWAESILQGATD